MFTPKSIILAMLISLTIMPTIVYAATPFDYIQNPHSRDGISLDGKWDIIPDPYETGYFNHRYEVRHDGYFIRQQPNSQSDLVEYDFSKSPKIDVPGDWNSQRPELFLYEGAVWYHKSFNYDLKSGTAAILHFGGANYYTIVYVNGKKVGEHEGGYGPFQFDVGEHLNKGENFVVVKVDNTRKREYVPTVNTDWWNYGGITRSVKLLTLPKAHIKDYRVQLSDSSSEEISTWITVAGNNSNQSTGKATISIPALSIEKDITIDKHGFGQLSFKAKPDLWSPDSPQLYDLILSYKDEQVKDTIGFRTIETKGEDILLNGKSVFLAGISLHEVAPFAEGRAWSKAHARTLLTWVKELGANFVRLAHYPHNENMLRMADELGLMVWSEVPVYWTVMFDSQEVYDKAELQLTEMLTRDKNRASIILWSVANETPKGDARLHFLSRLIKSVKTLDSSRLVTAALDTHTSKDNVRIIDDPLAKVVDVIGINNYCGWYYNEAQNCAGLKWQSKENKPMIMSEMGAGALQGHHGEIEQRWTEEFQVEVYRHNLAMADNISFLRGITPWILTDFRSPRRPLPEIQDFWNRKGLISDKGQKKQAFYFLQNYYHQKLKEKP